MEYIKAIIIKFIMVTTVLWLVLGFFYGVGLGSILLMSIGLTGASFIIGDLYLLPRFENWGAAIADFLMTFFVIWLFSKIIAPFDFALPTAAGISAVLIAICEVFFHKYVDSHILQIDDRTGDRTASDMDNRLQTEFGEESMPSDPIDTKDDY